MDAFISTLFLLLQILSFVQRGYSQDPGAPINGCFSTVDCSGQPLNDTVLNSNSRDCCIAEDPLAYTSTDGTCIACRVIGWESVSFTLEESGVLQQISVSVIKGSVSFTILSFSIQEILGTATRVDDYSPPSSGPVTIRPVVPRSVFLQGNGDQISQEGDETFSLQLSLSSGTFPTGVFFRNNLPVVIIDSTFVALSWTENEYRANEPTREVVGFIRPNATLAREINVTVLPLTYPDVISRNIQIPPNVPPAAGLTSLDFTRERISVTIPVGPPSQIPVSIPIEDDLIDEVQEEGFFALIVFESVGVTFPNLVANDETAQITLARIADDDTTGFTFELSDYTFLEEDSNQDYAIRIMRETESEIIHVIEVNLTTFSGACPNEATFTQDFSLVDGMLLAFTPMKTTASLNVTVLADQLVENVECFSLSISRPSAERITPQPPGILSGTHPTATVFIPDGDEVVVRFVETSYSVGEGEGQVEICIAILSPPESPDSADISFEVLLNTVTIPGEASDVSDFTPVDNTTLQFNLNSSREQCVNVEVNNDDIAEIDEQFQAQLSFHQDENFTRVRVDPALVDITIKDDDIEPQTTQQTAAVPAESSGLSRGEIAGIVIGSIAGGLLLAAYTICCCILCCYRRRREDEREHTSKYPAAEGAFIATNLNAIPLEDYEHLSVESFKLTFANQGAESESEYEPLDSD